jgi:tetratricopeptide (TPR) repeat protein
VRLAKRAVELGKDDAVALMAAGIALSYFGDLYDAAAFVDQALELNPNLALAWLFGGYVKTWLGEPEEGIERITHAMRLSPHDPAFFLALSVTAQAHFIAGRYVEAFSWAEKAARANPDKLVSYSAVAACGVLAGQAAVAERAVERLRQLQPGLRTADLMELLPLRRPEDRARWVDGLRKAGVPE